MTIAIEHLRGSAKTARNPIPIVPVATLAKPDWIRVKAGGGDTFRQVKQILREQGLHTVCEEATCPNIGECFGKGTATFMILGDLCTRRCLFCDVAHGRPEPPDPEEPEHLARTVAKLGLKYVVITSVDRDDLRDGGARHFANCIDAVREHSPDTRIEVLVPDFRGRLDVALDILTQSPPDVMNHNLETVPRLYRQVWPGADYAHSLNLLRDFKQRLPEVLTKSGLMLGLGETDTEVLQVMQDMRVHAVNLLTVGQYLQPRQGNLAVQRYVTPESFRSLELVAGQMGFTHAVCGPLVRSSYYADHQAHAVGV